MREKSATQSPKKSRKASATSVCATQAQVAKSLGVVSRSVREWLALGAPGRPGHYDPVAIARWHEANVAKKIDAERSGNGHAPDYAVARARREMALAALAELELAERERRLIDVSEPARIMRRVAAVARVHFEGMPDRVLADMPAALEAGDLQRVKKSCEGIVASMLAAFAAGLDELSDEAGDGGGD